MITFVSDMCLQICSRQRLEQAAEQALIKNPAIVAGYCVLTVCDNSAVLS